jgi:hypothetical protein
LQLESTYPNLIASKTLLDEDRFERLLEKYAANLAANSSLSPAMQEKLYALGEESVSRVLASNPASEANILDRLFESGMFTASLASNPSLSSDKLESLALSSDAEVLSALAANTSTPIEVLYQLSLDRRFERAVKTNPTFGKHIQTHNIGWY